MVVRLIKGQARVEVDYTVGPIPQEAFEGGYYQVGRGRGRSALLLACRFAVLPRLIALPLH